MLRDLFNYNLDNGLVFSDLFNYNLFSGLVLSDFMISDFRNKEFVY